MEYTSMWEFKCFYFPDVALEEFKDSLSSSELAAFLASVSLNELAKRRLDQQ